MRSRLVARLLPAISLVLVALLVSTDSVQPSSSHRKTARPRIFTLSVSEDLQVRVGSPKGTSLRIVDGVPHVYMLDWRNQVVVYNTKTRRSTTLPTTTHTPNALAVGGDGLIYVADSEANLIQVIDTRRGSAKKVSVHRPDSIALLSNGDIVVASHFGRKLVHVYDKDGRLLRGFGDVKIIDQGDPIQNAYLNRGGVLVDSNDNIYFVTLYAPVPTVQRFSRNGKLISEFFITGASADLQSDVAERFLKVRHQNTYGGVRVVTCAAVDTSTNHIWIGVNGSSQTGVLYEYTPEGGKVGEYILDIPSSETGRRPLTRLVDVVSNAGSLYVFDPRAVYSFLVSDRLAGNILPQTEPPACPQDIGWPQCKTSCDTQSTQDDQDCTAALQAVVNTGNTSVVTSSCDQLPGSCRLSVTLCNKTTGTQSLHSIDLTCPTRQEEMGYHIGGGVDCSLCTDGQDNDFDEDIDYDDLGCSSCDPSPIIIDTRGDGFDLTDAPNGVWFDITATGRPLRIAWCQDDDVLLVLDRNANGTIDNGRELFGNFAPQPPSADPNGFRALAIFDTPSNGGNGDGRINNRDAIFAALRLWRDDNHNGISEPAELYPLLSLGIAGLDLRYKHRVVTIAMGTNSGIERRHMTVRVSVWGDGRGTSSSLRLGRQANLGLTSLFL